ncbi:hypothetical protein TNCT_690141 [Trichonephila clavata]|uniref:Uncharacterized protein n=1 Tax=Trichonephila clavata TaxID=2740835 RepID=A0A8X6H1N0_TRICU|nr:hypothetical protein TNCT_690141 [Trichonephila clavata]
MKLIEDFNTVPSLVFIAMTRIVIWAWNLPDIVRSISQLLDTLGEIRVERMWKDIVDQVRVIVLTVADIPETLRSELDAVILPVGLHIRQMRTFVSYSPYSPSSFFEFPVNCWTSYGTVDTTRLDELLVRDERRLIGFRYALACHDCFEDIVEELFHELTPTQVLFLQMQTQTELLSYWTHRVTNDLFNFVILNTPLDVGRGPNVAHKLAFKYTLRDGSKTGIRYFLDTLPFNEFEYVSNSFLFYLEERPITLFNRPRYLPIPPKEHYSDSMYFLLSTFKEEQRNNILPGHHTAVMLNFLMYPFYGLFSRYGNIWRSNFSLECFYYLLTEIAKLQSLNTNFLDYRLFADLWSICPLEYKIFITNHDIEIYVATGDHSAHFMLELIRDLEER